MSWTYVWRARPVFRAKMLFRTIFITFGPFLVCQECWKTMFPKTTNVPKGNLQPDEKCPHNQPPIGGPQRYQSAIIPLIAVSHQVLSLQVSEALTSWLQSWLYHVVSSSLNFFVVVTVSSFHCLFTFDVFCFIAFDFSSFVFFTCFFLCFPYLDVLFFFSDFLVFFLRLLLLLLVLLFSLASYYPYASIFYSFSFFIFFSIFILQIPLLFLCFIWRTHCLSFPHVSFLLFLINQLVLLVFIIRYLVWLQWLPAWGFNKRVIQKWPWKVYPIAPC